MRIMWCVTGGEYLLADCVRVLGEVRASTIVFSRAGEEVASMYGLLGEAVAAAEEAVFERTHGYSSPAIMRLRRFDMVVVAPCTSNTVAKIVCGISDALIPNIVSQALKMGVPVTVLPTDAAAEVSGKTVTGGDVRIRCRQVDLDNIERLKSEVQVVDTIGELRDAIQSKV